METSKERIIAGRRHQRNINKKIVFYGSVFLVVFSLLYFFLHRPWLAFGIIVVEGGRDITVEEVKKVADVKEPINILNIDWGKLEYVLSNDLRVEKVNVKYAWPNILRIIVKERKPAIYMECAYGGFAKVGFDGRVLEVGKGIRDSQAPCVTGWKLDNVYTGDLVREEEVMGLLKFLGKLDKAITGNIAEINIDGNGNIKVYLNNGVPVLLGNYENAQEKTDTFITICNELETKKINAKYIDLTFKKPYIKLN